MQVGGGEGLGEVGLVSQHRAIPSVQGLCTQKMRRSDLCSLLALLGKDLLNIPARIPRLAAIRKPALACTIRGSRGHHAPPSREGGACHRVEAF